MYNPAQNEYEIHKLLKDRWSPRAFVPTAVESAKLMSLFEAARWSPSGGNTQPWAFVVVTLDSYEQHQKLVASLTGRNPDWATNAPVLVVAVAKMNPERPAFNRYAYYDLGQSVAHLSVQATDLGLHVHQMGGFDGATVRQVLGIPEGYEPLTVIAIGYYGGVEDLPEDLHQRELAPRSRKPLAEFVFADEWGKAVAPAEANLLTNVG